MVGVCSHSWMQKVERLWSVEIVVFVFCPLSLENINFRSLARASGRPLFRHNPNLRLPWWWFRAVSSISNILVPNEVKGSRICNCHTVYHFCVTQCIKIYTAKISVKLVGEMRRSLLSCRHLWTKPVRSCDCCLVHLSSDNLLWMTATLAECRTQLGRWYTTILRSYSRGWSMATIVTRNNGSTWVLSQSWECTYAMPICLARCRSVFNIPALGMHTMHL